MAALALGGVHVPVAIGAPMFFLGMSHGLIQPPVQSGAVAPFPHAAGAAAALLGFMMMLIAACVGIWIGVSYNGTVYPLTLDDLRLRTRVGCDRVHAGAQGRRHLGSWLMRDVLLLGPTASGKSALAMQLAEKIPLEIVSVDSAQVYRGMDIGTAKPSAADRAAVPHHLIDIRDPADPYSAADFVRDATLAIREIRAARQAAAAGRRNDAVREGVARGLVRPAIG